MRHILSYAVMHVNIFSNQFSIRIFNPGMINIIVGGSCFRRNDVVLRVRQLRSNCVVIMIVYFLVLEYGIFQRMKQFKQRDPLFNRLSIVICSRYKLSKNKKQENKNEEVGNFLCHAQSENKSTMNL